MSVKFSNNNYCIVRNSGIKSYKNSCKGDGCKSFVCYQNIEIKSYKVSYYECQKCHNRCEICNGLGSLDWIDMLVKK